MPGKAVSPAIQDMSVLVHQCEICFYWSGIHLFHQIGSARAQRSCVWHIKLLCTKNAFRLHIYISMKEKEKMQCFLFSLTLHYLSKKKKSHFIKSVNCFPLNCKEDTELEEFHVQQTKSRFCVSSLLDLSLSSMKRESPTFREVPASTC